MPYIQSEVSYACCPKMKKILNMWEGFLSYRFHSRFKENMQKEHTKMKLGKIGAHLEASARKSLVHFAQQIAISASIAWTATKICIYIHTRQLWFIDCAVATDCGKNGVNCTVIWCMMDRQTPLSFFLATKLGFILVDMQTLRITENHMLIHHKPLHD